VRPPEHLQERLLLGGIQGDPAFAHERQEAR